MIEELEYTDACQIDPAATVKESRQVLRVNPRRTKQPADKVGQVGRCHYEKYGKNTRGVAAR